jgi:hypothetical protein
MTHGRQEISRTDTKGSEAEQSGYRRVRGQQENCGNSENERKMMLFDNQTEMMADNQLINYAPNSEKQSLQCQHHQKD